MPDVYIQIPKTKVVEGSSFTATAYFRTGDAGAASTTAKYRVDNLTTGEELKDWTTLSVAESISIAMTATFNAIKRDGNSYEKIQLSVASDPDTATATIATATWTVRNVYGYV